MALIKRKEANGKSILSMADFEGFTGRISMNKTRCFLTIIILIFLFSVSLADVPRKISYQGILKDSIGNPVPDGTYPVLFKMYDPEGGELWAETTSVNTTDGYFNVLLGNVNPIPKNLFIGAQTTLGITIEPGNEMTPRLPMVSTSYSFAAEEIAGVSDTAQWNELLDLLGNAADGIQQAYASASAPGDLAENINNFAYSFISSYGDFLGRHLEDYNPTIHQALSEALDSVLVYAIDDLNTRANLIDSAQAYNDIPTLLAFDAEVEDHDLLRLANVCSNTADVLGLGWFDWIKEKILHYLKKILILVLKDIPGVGDAVTKIMEALGGEVDP